ncbi:MAG: hypothetical protein V4524_01170 [Patescibacteria group bacterium]
MSKHQPSGQYYTDLKKKLLDSAMEPDKVDALMELIELRDKMEEQGFLPPYYPRGTIRFFGFKRPEEKGEPMSGLYFQPPLSHEDRLEVLEHFKDIPDQIPWRSLGTRAEILSAYHAKGLTPPKEILKGGCGDASCHSC